MSSESSISLYRSAFAKIFTITLLAFFSTTAFGQVKMTWNLLADISYEPKYFEEYDAEYLSPIFGKSPIAYSGKEVLVTGYIIPLDAEGSGYILSKNPYASCYFCGNAGPETIVELWMKPKKTRRYQMDERLTFKGKLRLNSEDVNHFNYILTEAEEY
ncbi:MAG: hypothetical protein AAF847_11995 [Bacteroidota bacterium]